MYHSNAVHQDMDAAVAFDSLHHFGDRGLIGSIADMGDSLPRAGRALLLDRGDAWVAVGMAEMLRSLPKNHPRRTRILKAYWKIRFLLKTRLLRECGDNSSISRGPGHRSRSARGHDLRAMRLSYGSLGMPCFTPGLPSKISSNLGSRAFVAGKGPDVQCFDWPKDSPRPSIQGIKSDARICGRGSGS